MNARDLALIDLDRTRLPGWRGGVVRTPRVDHRDVDPRDRALAEQIRVGVIKNLLLLQHLIAHHSGRPIKSIHEVTQKTLAIGLYQLRFLDRIPESAAVDQAVEQTRRFGRRGAAGFVNAVLRNALRARDPQLTDEVRLSHPPALLTRLRTTLGDQRAVAFCEHNNREPPTLIRLFAGATIEQLHSIAGGTVTFTPHEQAGMFVIGGAKKPLLAELAQRGLAQVQDATAALAVDACGARPGQRVLDRCAGLGTKTLQLRDRVGETGTVVAMDPNQARCGQLSDLARRRGVDQNMLVISKGWMDELDEALRAPFDRVLVDVPCSNSGVLARRPEARYAQDERSLESLRELQLKILRDTAPFTRPGGLLIYSTCSIWPEENEGAVRAFLTNRDNFVVMAQRLTLPAFVRSPESYRDGGFFAVMQRR